MEPEIYRMSVSSDAWSFLEGTIEEELESINEQLIQLKEKREELLESKRTFKDLQKALRQSSQYLEINSEPDKTG